MLLQIAMKAESLLVVLTARLAARFKCTRRIDSIRIAVASNKNPKLAQPIKRHRSSAKAASMNQTTSSTKRSSWLATYFRVMTMAEPMTTVSLSSTLQVKLLGQANSLRISNSQMCSRWWWCSKTCPKTWRLLRMWVWRLRFCRCWLRRVAIICNLESLWESNRRPKWLTQSSWIWILIWSLSLYHPTLMSRKEKWPTLSTMARWGARSCWIQIQRCSYKRRKRLKKREIEMRLMNHITMAMSECVPITK